MSRQDRSGMIGITTGSGANGARGLRVLVAVLVLAVVGWGVGYRAALYSSQSLTGNTVPPARMLAHRACPERGFAVAHKALQDQVIAARANFAQSFADAAREPGLALAAVYRGRSVEARSWVAHSVTGLCAAPRPPPTMA